MGRDTESRHWVKLEPQLTHGRLRLGNNNDQRGPTAFHNPSDYEPHGRRSTR